MPEIDHVHAPEPHEPAAKSHSGSPQELGCERLPQRAHDTRQAHPRRASGGKDDEKDSSPEQQEGPITNDEVVEERRLPAVPPTGSAQ
jgi:hypothetical protein